MNKNIKILILFIIILLSTIFEITGLSLKFGINYIYIIKPLLWIFVGIITLFFFKNDIIVNLKYQKKVNFYVIIATLIYFIIYFGMGYVKGFAYNPYDRSFDGLLLNLWTFIPVILVKEYIRFYMITNCGKKKILIWAILISLLFTIVDINIYKLDSYFLNGLTILEFVIKTFIPSIITNLFLTYICYFSGYKTAIIYSLLPQISLYILPILPDVDWTLISILNCVVPFFSYIFINYMINKEDKTLKRKEIKVVNLKQWAIMLIIVILMVCFGLGMFPVEPLVIASNSMYPKIKKGDLIIIKEKDVKDIKKGEIIRYKMDGYYVVHRVIKINIDKDGKLNFIAKGDNNDNIDLYPVKENQVAGVVKFDIPYVGYPTLIVSKLLNPDAEDKVIVDKGRIN